MTEGKRESRRERKAKESFAERDPLAAEQPDVLESSASDPEFPAMQEFEVDSGGPKGSTGKHPGLVWLLLAAVAVAALIFGMMALGDWMTPSAAERQAQVQFDEQTIPEDMGANENPEAEKSLP